MPRLVAAIRVLVELGFLIGAVIAAFQGKWPEAQFGVLFLILMTIQDSRSD